MAVANEKPNLVKAVVSFEGATAPLVGPGGAAGTPLPEPEGHADHVSAVRAWRPAGQADSRCVAAVGCARRVIDLKERSILGNSHFAMCSRTTVVKCSTVIKGWIEQRVPSGTSHQRAALTARGVRFERVQPRS
jgi:hypothetical protein